jgi:hypothetical protein
MQRLEKLSMGKLTALCTVVALLTVVVARGHQMFSPGPLSSEAPRQVAQGGVHSHAELADRCAACHVSPWSSESMADRCLDCHAGVRGQFERGQAMHGLLAEGMECRSCHTEHKGAHAVLTSLDTFDHNVAAFKLTGKHTAVACASCHVKDVYKGTPQTCASCHAEPQVHKGRLGTDCARCHATTTWRADTIQLTSSKFDHSQAAFKLTGKHATVACASCHVQNVFKGTPQTCASCHAEPPIHKGRLGTDCARCHATSSWIADSARMVSLPFDHNQTAFRLTGKHTELACASCHVKDVYKSTPQTCAACHAEPAVHKGQFGTNCTQCHATHGWEYIQFKHTVPINHGARNKGKNSCTTCHTNLNDFVSYTCYGCHTHAPANMEARHVKRGIKDYADCAKCHFGGRGGKRTALLECPAPELCQGLDEPRCPGESACTSCPTPSPRMFAACPGTDDLYLAEVRALMSARKLGQPTALRVVSAPAPCKLLPCGQLLPELLDFPRLAGKKLDPYALPSCTM